MAFGGDGYAGADPRSSVSPSWPQELLKYFGIRRRRVLVLDDQVVGELQPPTKVVLQFLEVHEPVKSVIEVSFVQRLIRPRVVDRLFDGFADADAQIAGTEAGVDGSAALEGALPL